MIPTAVTPAAANTSAKAMSCARARSTVADCYNSLQSTDILAIWPPSRTQVSAVSFPYRHSHFCCRRARDSAAHLCVRQQRSLAWTDEHPAELLQLGRCRLVLGRRWRRRSVRPSLVNLLQKWHIAFVLDRLWHAVPEQPRRKPLVRCCLNRAIATLLVACRKAQTYSGACVATWYPSGGLQGDFSFALSQR